MAELPWSKTLEPVGPALNQLQTTHLVWGNLHQQEAAGAENQLRIIGINFKNRGICFSLPTQILQHSKIYSVREEVNLWMFHPLPELCPGTDQALAGQDHSKSSRFKQTLNSPSSCGAGILFFSLPWDNPGNCQETITEQGKEISVHPRGGTACFSPQIRTSDLSWGDKTPVQHLSSQSRPVFGAESWPCSPIPIPGNEIY